MVNLFILYYTNIYFKGEDENRVQEEEREIIIIPPLPLRQRKFSREKIFGKEVIIHVKGNVSF